MLTLHSTMKWRPSLLFLQTLATLTLDLPCLCSNLNPSTSSAIAAELLLLLVLVLVFFSELALCCGIYYTDIYIYRAKPHGLRLEKQTGICADICSSIQALFSTLTLSLIYYQLSTNLLLLRRFKTIFAKIMLNIM